MNEPIKVVIPTIHRPECPTIRSRLLPWCRILTGRGFSFTILVLDVGSKEIYPGVIFRGYANYFELAKIVVGLRRTWYDIILSCKPYSLSGVLPWLIARLQGMGYVLDVDDRISPSEINKWWRLPIYVQEWCMEQLLRALKPITIVASHALAAYWGQNSNYVPNTVDLKLFFRRKNIDENTVRKRLGLNDRIVIWPAVFFQEIDRDYILEVFRCVSRKSNGISLLIIGAGEYLPELKKKVSASGMTNVRFADAVEHGQMPEFYAAADAGILPLRDNHYDACKCPIKLYEYMAMELPVIATPVGEPASTIEKADCGIIIPFQDAGIAADLIIDLFRSDERLRTLGQNGRRYLEKFQHLEGQAEKVKSILLTEWRAKTQGGTSICRW